ncbi:MAG: hypothetical protein IPL41_07505 [Micropruina sp.]|nr:hypothetical protein [Micropruina sp.]
MKSVPSPERNTSISSDKAESDKAIGELSFDEYLAVHIENLADGPLTQDAAPSPKPHHSPGLCPRVELLCVEDSLVVDHVAVGVWLDSLRESELVNVGLPVGVAEFSADQLASLALAIVDGGMRRLGQARGWPASAMDHAREHVVVSGFRFVWHGDWKSSRNRQLRARLRVELLDTGFGELSIQVADNDSDDLVAESPPYKAYATVEGFRRSGRTLRWVAQDELEVSPYCGPRGLYDDKKARFRMGPLAPVRLGRGASPRQFVEPPLPVRVCGRGSQAPEQPHEIMAGGMGPTNGVPLSYTDELWRLFEQLDTPQWQAWWSGAPHAVLEIDAYFGPKSQGPTARAGNNVVRARINRWPKAIDRANGAEEARNDLRHLLEKLQLRFGLGPIPPLH